MAEQSHAEHEELEPEISVAEPLPEAPERDLIGERFGKYLIVGELATGGMAEVFLGVHRGLEGFVKVAVIKRVLRQYGNNPEFVQMFVDEARLAARLEHPNIVRTYEFGEVEGQYFTTMEYLAGEDLSKALHKLAFAKQQMPLSTAAGIMNHVCAGLHFAHQLTDTGGRPLNLVHRDVNPANIILTYGGEVKIIDFGVAKTDANKTLNGTIKGKVAYMSPEQLVARGVDRRSDVFSAGVVLWEMLTGRSLFLKDNEAATLYAIMNDPIRPPSRYRPDVPPALDEIAMCALSRTPADRYETAEEMGEALEKFLATQQKFDSRVVGRLMEDLFGSTRADAKRSIAQTRSLGRNISLVMKMRTEVRVDLREHLEDVLAGSSPRELVAPQGSRWPTFAMAAVIVACIVGGVVYALVAGPGSSSSVAATPSTTAGASLEITSDPPGAAISIDGEPTGRKTPATFTGLASKEVSVRLEHPDLGTATERIAIPASGAITKHVGFVRGVAPGVAPGRLVIANLPKGATIVVDGEVHDAGTVIGVGPGVHEVRIVVGGRTIAQARVETGAGDHRWKLTGGTLVRDGGG